MCTGDIVTLCKKETHVMLTKHTRLRRSRLVYTSEIILFLHHIIVYSLSLSLSLSLFLSYTYARTHTHTHTHTHTQCPNVGNNSSSSKLLRNRHKRCLSCLEMGQPYKRLIREQLTIEIFPQKRIGCQETSQICCRVYNYASCIDRR